MSTELTAYDGATAMPAKIDYATKLAQSGLLPEAYQRKPENVLWAIEYGAMLNLSPMVAITMVHVISGKPTASAGLISALVRRAGHKLRVRGDAASATAQIIRSDDPDYTFEVTWTMQRAQTAKLTGNANWTKYPAAMLSARAITECARLACQEALLGMQYTPEELGAAVDEDGQVMQQATRVPERPARVLNGDMVPENGNSNGGRTIFDAKGITRPEPAPEPAVEPAVDADNLAAAIDATDDPDTLRQVWHQTAGLPAEQRDDLRTVITAKIQARQEYLDAAAAEPVDAELVDEGASA